MKSISDGGFKIKPVISPFSTELFLDKFDCGDEEVNDFLKEKALSQEKGKITKIFIIHKDKRVIAYSAVFCSHLYFKLPDQDKEFRVPGICLGQLGVDIEFQGKGLGTILIKHTISLANKIGNYSGCRIIYLEARDDAVDYYKNLRFYLVEPKPNRNRMVFDLIQT